MKIYQGMPFATVKPEQTVQEILDTLQEYAIDVTNETYEYFMVQQR